MRPQTAAPRKRSGGLSRGIGVVVILVAAVIIIAVAYFATRPGGFKGKMDINQWAEYRAKQLGYANGHDFWKYGGAAVGQGPPMHARPAGAGVRHAGKPK